MCDASAPAPKSTKSDVAWRCAARVKLKDQIYAVLSESFAAVALFRFKVGVLPLLGACAVVGLACTWLLSALSA